MDSSGKKIKKLREDLGLSQEELMKKLEKTSKQTISNWENDRSEPTIHDYRKLAEIFSTTVSYLIGESTAPSNTSSDTITISKDEFIELQRKALKQEEAKVKKLEEQVSQLKND
ncbi:helix-turn-helix domain-containing protein [Dyadobacter diqingensis]|uniref:helix-turn-helix domain-containing protein n=1 Tax=Dyadobacter diqingensis TaxID=2938121 RepID=UPI0020C525D4|nr:helix-turn-helix transcriptional regulator [Dyadobacter diqingensis]